MPPEINYEKCIACSRCADICAEDVFFGSKKGQKPEVTYPEVCFHCYCCIIECPVEGAIKLRTPLSMTVSYKQMD
jgi:adenylylsulfate reductase, subunit B